MTSRASGGWALSLRCCPGSELRASQKVDLVFGAAPLVVDKSAWLMRTSVACLTCNDPDLFLSTGFKLETVKPVGLSLETICLWLSSGKLGNLSRSAFSYLKNPAGS